MKKNYDVLTILTIIAGAVLLLIVFLSLVANLHPEISGIPGFLGPPIPIRIIPPPIPPGWELM